MRYLTASEPPQAVLLDTAALAAHLGCTPAYVRLFVSERIIEPIGRRSLRGTGRPTMWFDADAVDKAIEIAADDGRVKLDPRLKIVRKSRSESVHQRLS